jgi:hypothetical protein
MEGGRQATVAVSQRLGISALQAGGRQRTGQWATLQPLLLLLAHVARAAARRAR